MQKRNSKFNSRDLHDIGSKHARGRLSRRDQQHKRALDLELENCKPRPDEAKPDPTQPPSNTEAKGSLSILNKPEEGGTIIADTSGIIDPDGEINFTFQWQSSNDNKTWANIPNATSSSYVIPSNQSLVSQYIRATAISTDSFHGSTLFESTGSQVQNLDDQATGSLLLIGEAKEGRTITADTKYISDPDGEISFTFQWQRSSDNKNWIDISGATASSYEIPTDQKIVDQYIRATSASTDGFNGTTFFESDGWKVLNIDKPATGSISIIGEVEEGRIITANTSDISDPDGPVNFSFQWQRSSDNYNWINISGATESSYSIPSDPSIAGQFIRVMTVSIDTFNGTTTFESPSSQILQDFSPPGFYEGTLSTNSPKGFGSVSSSAKFRDYDPITNAANYWSIKLKAGESIQIRGTRLEEDYDMALWLFQGSIVDPAATFSGGRNKLIDLFDPGIIELADDDLENPGPFDDPLTAIYTATSDIKLTAIVTNFASGLNDGGDGLFNYGLEIVQPL